MSGARKKSSFQITSISSEEPAGAAPGNGPPGAASRFRLVKLDPGPGEPYTRGRWTCRDFREPEPRAAGRLLEAARHPQSLDSRLELAGHGGPPPPSPRRAAHPPGPAPPGEHLPRSLGGGERTPGGREELLLPPGLAQRMRREAEERHKVPPHGSRPSSPAPAFAREGSPVRRGSDPFRAHLSLARSMFAMGGHQDSDDESSSAGSMIAIDNKIEQAMDLVKSHLMLAVREEVEVLREQIKDLAERNAALEWENGLLRALASPEQLSQLQSQLRRPSA